MKRRIVWTAIGLMIAASGAPRAASAADSSQYNVLLIVSDDLRCELGCYGSKLAKTPNLDALAAAGVRFDHAYCQFSLCNPSRSSMLTGRYPTTTGVLGNRTWFGDMHPEFVSLPKHFKNHGYASLRCGKIFHNGLDDTDAWTVGGEVRQYTGEVIYPGRGRALPNDSEDSFEHERSLTKNQHSDQWLVIDGEGESSGDSHRASRAIQFLRKYRDKPFFLAVGFDKPHSPPEAPQRFYDQFDLDQIELPADFAARPTAPPGFPALSVRNKNADLFIARDASREEAKQMIRAYLASVSWMDSNVGRVLDALDQLDLRRKTIIVFWGDNGYQLGEKGKWSKAGSLFEQTVRVPLIIVAPGAQGNGQPSPRIVQSLDIYPTLCELCGLPQAAGMEGRSIAPLLANPSAEWNHPAYTLWSEDGSQLTGVAVRTEQWRYAEFDAGRGGELLLKPDADPQESKNLANDPELADVKRELSGLIKTYLKTSKIASDGSKPAP